MKLVSEFMWETVKASGCQYQSVCGVPYTALPIATCISVSHGIPMLIRRKEAKDYGTKKMIEGKFSAGDKCLILEDVVTSGTSVFETAQSLNAAGLTVTDAVVLLDREQGGKHRLKDDGITLHSVCGVSQILEVLQRAGKLSVNVVEDVHRFISDNNTYNPPSVKPVETAEVPRSKCLTYAERSAASPHLITQKLFSIMEEKASNLALSADVTSSQQLLQLADVVGPYICVLKTHVDIVADFCKETAQRLRNLAHKHNFIIFEDRKFADIGNTVKHQVTEGSHHICDFADLVNAHALPGPGVIRGLQEASSAVSTSVLQGCLLIAEMSSAGNLFTGDYSKSVVSMADSHKDFVVGFISQSKVSDDPCYIHMTPGVKLETGGDGLGQQYSTPSDVITGRGNDVIIVGRGITQAPDPASAAKLYRDAGYAAYMAKLS